MADLCATKNLFMKSVLLAFVFFNSVSTLRAQSENFAAGVVPKSNGQFVLVIENPLRESLQVTVWHEQFGTVSETQIHSKNLRCLYNLAATDDGRYTIAVTNGKTKWHQSINMTTTTEIRREIKVVSAPHGF